MSTALVFFYLFSCNFGIAQVVPALNEATRSSNNKGDQTPLPTVMPKAVAPIVTDNVATVPDLEKSSASANKEQSSAGSVIFTLENSLNLRDPFRKFVPKAAVGIKVPELERCDLTNYQLVGIITGPKKNKAIITTLESGSRVNANSCLPSVDADGKPNVDNSKMSIATEGMRIGVRGGVIKKISRSMIFVEEKLVNLLGQEENIEVPIELKSVKGMSEKTGGRPSGPSMPSVNTRTGT